MWSDEIKAMRTAAKQTQAQAAEFLRVSKRSIESWETGKREPKEHTKNGIREIYNFYYREHPEREPEPQRVPEPEPVRQPATQETTQRKVGYWETRLKTIGNLIDCAIDTDDWTLMQDMLIDLDTALNEIGNLL